MTTMSYLGIKLSVGVDLVGGGDWKGWTLLACTHARLRSAERALILAYHILRCYHGNEGTN